jgi:signal transduction histidine kinase
MLRTLIDRRPLSPLSITLVLMLASLIGCIVTSGLLFEKRKELVRSITESGSENFTWAFNQLRVEFYRLQALSEGLIDRRDSLEGKEWEATLRKRYEIFVSRINTVDVGSYRTNMLATDIYARTMPVLKDLVIRMDAALGSQQGYSLGAVSLYLKSSRELAPLIDEMTAKAVEVDSERLNGMRNLLVSQQSLEQTNLLFQLVILIAFAGVAFYGLYRLDRQRVRLVATAEALKHARANEEMASEAKRRALQKALDEEQRHGRLQRRFVSMASHEFRTPLAIIDSTAQRLLRKLDRLTSDEIKDRVERIRNTVARMGDLIGTMLEAGRSEEGKTEFNPGVIDVEKVMRVSIKRQQELAPDHRLIQEFRDLPPLYYGDARLIDQILGNLLTNAVKYSSKGSNVYLSASGHADGLQISVTDQGVGIPADEIAQIGEVFFRASTSAGIPGTGVGLNLVKKFVALHGGTLRVDSRVGIGTTFTINLPAADELVPPVKAKLANWV